MGKLQLSSWRFYTQRSFSLMTLTTLVLPSESLSRSSQNENESRLVPRAWTRRLYPGSSAGGCEHVNEVGSRSAPPNSVSRPTACLSSTPITVSSHLEPCSLFAPLLELRSGDQCCGRTRRWRLTRPDRSRALSALSGESSDAADGAQEAGSSRKSGLGRWRTQEECGV